MNFSVLFEIVFPRLSVKLHMVRVRSKVFSLKDQFITLHICHHCMPRPRFGAIIQAHCINRRLFCLPAFSFLFLFLTSCWKYCDFIQKDTGKYFVLSQMVGEVPTPNFDRIYLVKSVSLSLCLSISFSHCVYSLSAKILVKACPFEGGHDVQS